MKTLNSPRTIRIALFSLLASGASVWAEEPSPLTLDQFLATVATSHQGYKATVEASAGAENRMNREARLITTPQVFASITSIDDGTPNLLFSALERTKSTQYTLGLQTQTTFGLQAKLGYSLQDTAYLGLAPPVSTGQYLSSPRLEVTQSLWRNFFGSETRATQAQVDNDVRAKHFEQSYQGKMILAEAENSYWGLALARQTLQVQKDALDRSQKILDWNLRRAKLQLGDQADAYQAEALHDLRKLQLEQATNDLRSASLKFNQTRGIASDQVTEILLPLNDKVLKENDIEKDLTREELRDDVQSAIARQDQLRAVAQLGKERNRPVLELFGAYGWNAVGTNQSDVVSTSFSNNRPTKIIGLRFSAPVDFYAVAKVQSGYTREQLAADLNVERRKFDADREWTDLTQKLRESRKRLELARSIEKAQEKKLTYERDRLNRGRSTTYQVLLFEQDFASSQLTRIQVQAEILNLIARIKTFRSTKGSVS